MDDQQNAFACAAVVSHDEMSRNQINKSTIAHVALFVAFVFLGVFLVFLVSRTYQVRRSLNEVSSSGIALTSSVLGAQRVAVRQDGVGRGVDGPAFEDIVESGRCRGREKEKRNRNDA